MAKRSQISYFFSVIIISKVQLHTVHYLCIQYAVKWQTQHNNYSVSLYNVVLYKMLQDTDCPLWSTAVQLHVVIYQILLDPNSPICITTVTLCVVIYMILLDTYYPICNKTIRLYEVIYTMLLDTYTPMWSTTVSL